MLLEPAQRLKAYMERLCAACPTATGLPARHTGLAGSARVRRIHPLTDGRLLRATLECLGADVDVFSDGTMLIWHLARHDGYNIPPYPLAGCGDVREFLHDECARNVPDWYARHLGIGPDLYAQLYQYQLVMVRNRSRFRTVFCVPVTHMQDCSGLGGHLPGHLLAWLSFALGTDSTRADGYPVFKR